MIVQQNQILENKGKKPILYDIYKPDTSGLKPVVIFCHGYKGFKDWGAWHLVGEHFAKAGFFFLKFNFSHNGGTIKQPIDFPDLEAFAQNNYTTELDDLDRIINHVTNTFKTEAILDNLNIIGHSRGGGIVLIKAEEDTRVHKVITWAGVSDYKSRFKIDSLGFEQWKKDGRMFVENRRTKQQMPHDWQFFEDFKNNEDRLTIERAAKKINKPWLIIHGNEDTSVQLEEGKTLKNWQPNAQFQIIENADHVFNTRHPWGKKELPKELDFVVNRSIDFIKK